ncbi:MAG: hypothetical protein ACI4HI_15770 [Lachnospiraceae bacterium]
MSVQGISALLVAAEAGSCLLFFGTFFEERYPKKGWVKPIVFCVMTFLFWMVALFFSDRIVIKACMMIVQILICIRFLYMGKWMKMLLFSMWYYTMGFVVDAACYYLLNGLGMDVTSVHPLWKFVVLGGISKLAFLLVVFLICQKKSASVEATSLTRGEWGGFVFFPVFSLIVCIQILSEKQVKMNTACLISIGLLFGNFMLYFLLRNTIKRNEMEKKLSLIQEQTEHQAREYRYIQESYEQQRKKAAEFRKELSEVKGFLQKKDVSGGLAYIENCDRKLAYHSNFFNTTNEAVNTVLTYQYLEAKKVGITLIYEITRITTLPMSEEKAVVLLSTVLGSGIRFCKKYKSTQVYCKLTQERSYLVISLKLSYPKELPEPNLEQWKEQMLDAASCQIILDACGQESVHVDRKEEWICYTVLFEASFHS